MSDHKYIYLEPVCCGELNPDGRMWCEDPRGDCEEGNPDVKYIRHDLYEQLEQSNKELLGLLRDLCGGGQFFWSAIELDYDFDGEAFEKRVLTAITNAEQLEGN